jgi:hypothetical protein
MAILFAEPRKFWRAGDAAGEGQGFERGVEGHVSERDLLAHFAEAAAELKRHLQQELGPMPLKLCSARAASTR